MVQNHVFTNTILFVANLISGKLFKVNITIIIILHSLRPRQICSLLFLKLRMPGPIWSTHRSIDLTAQPSSFMHNCLGAAERYLYHRFSNEMMCSLSCQILTKKTIRMKWTGTMEVPYYSNGIRIIVK